MELIINTYGTSLNRDNEGFVISTSEGRQRIPAEGIKSIQISRGAQITSDAVMLAVEREIEVLFMDRTGNVIGRIWSPRYGSVSTIRKGQLNFSLSHGAIDWIKDVISQKVENQQALLLAMTTEDVPTRNRVNTAIRRLEDYRNKVKQIDGEVISDIYSTLRGADGRPILSLAERVFMGYTKSLLSQNRASDLAEWEPQLSKQANEDPSYTYLPYYLAKVRLSLGKAEQVMESMKTFVKKKRGEFWVWELLGDATHDPDHRFFFYAKAMTCNTKDEMLVSMREKMVNQLIARKYYPEAHCELDRLLATRQKHRWAISSKLLSFKNEDWYIQTTSANAINTFYKPFAQKAEEVVLGTNTDECKTVRGVLKKNKAGFGFVEDVFVPSWLIENIGNGENVELKAIKSFDKKKNQWGWKASKISKTPG